MLELEMEFINQLQWRYLESVWNDWFPTEAVAFNDSGMFLPEHLMRFTDQLMMVRTGHSCQPVEVHEQSPLHQMVISLQGVGRMLVYYVLQITVIAGHMSTPKLFQ